MRHAMSSTSRRDAHLCLPGLVVFRKQRIEESREQSMTRSIVKLTAVLPCVALCLLAAAASAANSSEQVIFSGGGYGTFENIDGPFGFWIWCEADSGNP